MGFNSGFKGLNTKFHENPSSGSRVVPWGQTDMTKLIEHFRYSTNAPKNTVCLHANSLQQDPLFVKKKYDSPKRREIMAQRHVVTSQKSCIFHFFFWGKSAAYVRCARKYVGLQTIWIHSIIYGQPSATSSWHKGRIAANISTSSSWYLYY